MPHTGCAQIGPLTSTTVVKTKPTSAAEMLTSPTSAAAKNIQEIGDEQMKNAVRPVHALDTCKIKNALDGAHGAFRGSHEKCSIGRRATRKKTTTAAQDLFSSRLFLQKIFAEKP